MHPKISVIVPIYKAEKYLHRCINSILAQTYTDFELILVDDGSPDKCGVICDEYVQKDSRIRVFHKENGGVTAARSDGVKISKGDYITFVDADDTLPEEALSILNINIDNDIDIIRGSIQTYPQEDVKAYDAMILNSSEYRKECICRRFLNSGPTASLIRRNLFSEKNIFNIPREVVYGEDMIMNIRLAFVADKKIKIISDRVYNYMVNPTSCVSTFNETINYIELWYKYIFESVPEQQINVYMNECINFRFSYINCLMQSYIKSNKWKKIPYHEQLLNHKCLEEHCIIVSIWFLTIFVSNISST